MKFRKRRELELSIILPCLNEEAAIGSCIEEAKRFIQRRNLRAEILVVDNGSTDATAWIARKHGARVISERHRGYGRAIRTGMVRSRGEVLILCDGDSTYDLEHADRFFDWLTCGKYDMMIGNRMHGGMERGAMPFLHRLGVPFLSWVGRKCYGTEVRDFHCGLRSVTRKAAQKLSLHSNGMEFATELIGEAARRGLRIGQTRVRLRRARYRRYSKLHTFSDGFRHLKIMIKGSRF